MYNFYIPLTAFKIDVERIKQELATLVKFDNVNIEIGKPSGAALTTIQSHVNDENYNFKQFGGISNYNKDGKREQVNQPGVLETDLVFYPKVLQGSYIQSVERDISAYLGLALPRVRMSCMAGPSTYGYHNDPHTPYRVHIALDTMPLSIWKFRTNNDYNIHQPSDGVPVLIETGKTYHALDVAPGTARYHIWFQYHNPVSQEILNRLLGK